MTHNSAPYLCGGVFFSLLEPVKYNGTARQKVNGKYKGVSDPEMMAALINVVTGFVPDSSASGFIKDVSRYRTCSFNGGKNIPFNKADVISAFDYDLKNDYNTLLNRMIDFTDSCILSEVPGRMNWLVKVILELIEKDPSISDEAKFYITADREGTYKSVIKRMSSFELQPFLLGVLHYFITAKKENTKGLDTYNRLFPTRDNHFEGTFNEEYLRGVNREITVTVLNKIDEEPTVEKTFDFSDTEQRCENDARVIAHYYERPTIVNQTAEKIYNIQNVDHLY